MEYEVQVWLKSHAGFGPTKWMERIAENIPEEEYDERVKISDSPMVADDYIEEIMADRFTMDLDKDFVENFRKIRNKMDDASGVGDFNIIGGVYVKFVKQGSEMSKWAGRILEDAGMYSDKMVEIWEKHRYREIFGNNSFPSMKEMNALYFLSGCPYRRSSICGKEILLQMRMKIQKILDSEKDDY